ncbi:MULTISPECIES: D-amino acid aminotransferase [unclassified Polaromonas]|uniref:D-amino acid aminotransferase n=1 Tax=unclassified Polaromonas TaxID=2638319 RepID=UPI0018C9BA74|nr:MULTISPECIES: D-amino acid aminotransferase [unclassified Polaromonas]MBG6072356.1 D-alanine transaminase [Polaromonas sp. CG_9.7]MBG6114213.1 D-alanine transaminase [Polaromonas sp. CG_9.2]MDH6182829.1 D-alanine transaminase [Polaromonas sp. CG_23.6]
MSTVAANALPETPCYLNGDFSTLRDAKISVLDRGFIFGDGVYEVVPAYAGKLFRFEQHMARLNRSLAELRIANPLTQDEWRDTALKLIADYALSTGADTQKSNQLIYIQVTRGVAMRDHPMLPGLTPTVFIMVNPMKLPSEAQRAQGVACVSAGDFRWEKAHIKSTSLLGAVFSRQISFDAGALETVMFRGDHLSEAAASNVWVVKNGTVMGPPRDHLVLEGIRYGLIEEICRAAGIAFELRTISRAEVLAADELLLSSATKEILPITLLDDQPVGHGTPGPVYAKLYAAYQQAKQELST